MFCDLTDSQRALRDELRAYFSGLLSPGERATLLTERHGIVYRDVVRRMGNDGWLGVAWPPEYGGRGLGQVEQQIFVSEAARADVPLPAVTLQTVGPVLQANGTAGQKEFFLPRILAGEVHFAIGYTEPEAGTDLASLRTRAVRDGDNYLVNGEKIFTTGGHDADYIWLACRTDAGAPKHKGISILIVGTADPGFSWTPITTHDGAHHTNATYYSDVRVPASSLVGSENGGWPLITNQLNHERVALTSAAPILTALREVTAWARETRLASGQRVIDSEWVQVSLARVHAKAEFLKLTNWRIASAAGAGLGPAAASATKVFGTEFATEAYRLLMEVLGANAAVRDGSPGAVLAGRIERMHRSALILTFGGGTNEVQRDIVAAAALGLPISRR